MGLTGSLASGSLTRLQSGCYPGLWSSQALTKGEIAFTWVIGGIPFLWAVGLKPQVLTSCWSEVHFSPLPREPLIGERARETTSKRED